MCEDIKSSGIDQEHSCVFNSACASGCNIIGNAAFDQALPRQIECGHNFAIRFIGFQHLLNEVRRKELRVSSRLRTKQTIGEFRDIRQNTIVPFALRIVQQTVFAINQQSATRRTLRNHAEYDRFRPGQTRCLFAKVNLARGVRAFDVPAIGSEIEIRFQNF